MILKTIGNCSIKFGPWLYAHVSISSCKINQPVCVTWYQDVNTKFARKFHKGIVVASLKKSIRKWKDVSWILCRWNWNPHVTAPMMPANWDQNPKAQFDARERCQLWTHRHLWPMQGWDLLLQHQHGMYIIWCIVSWKHLILRPLPTFLESWNHDRHLHKQYDNPSRMSVSMCFFDIWRTTSSSPRQQLFATVRPLIERRPHHIQITHRKLQTPQFNQLHRNGHCQCTGPCRSWLQTSKVHSKTRAVRMQSSFLSVFSSSLKHDGTSAFLAPNTREKLKQCLKSCLCGVW